jgi:lipopolysaccharide biosynthesis glycosyltransferase
MNTSKKIFNVSCAIDDSYVYPLAVLLVSLFENHKDVLINFHLCSASFTQKNIDQIETLCHKYSNNFKFYKLNPEDFKNLKYVDRFSMATYYRLLVADNIDKDVDLFLHLDADMIVVDRIDELFELDLQDKIFGTANDITAIDWKLHRKHHIPDDYLYFNSGAILINRKKWVDFKVTDKTINYLMENSETCDYVDQDALNNSMYQYRYRIPSRYNQQIGVYFVNIKELNIPFEKDYHQAAQNPAIIHFNGMEKPWYFYCGHPYRSEFLKYAELVKDFDILKANFSLKKWIKKNIFYNIIGWRRVHKYFYYKTRPSYS